VATDPSALRRPTLKPRSAAFGMVWSVLSGRFLGGLVIRRPLVALRVLSLDRHKSWFKMCAGFYLLEKVGDVGVLAFCLPFNACTWFRSGPLGRTAR
jgi:hypothetical protein